MVDVVEDLTMESDDVEEIIPKSPEEWVIFTLLRIMCYLFMW